MCSQILRLQAMDRWLSSSLDKFQKEQGTFVGTHARTLAKKRALRDKAWSYKTTAACPLPCAGGAVPQTVSLYVRPFLQQTKKRDRWQNAQEPRNWQFGRLSGWMHRVKRWVEKIHVRGCLSSPGCNEEQRGWLCMAWLLQASRASAT